MATKKAAKKKGNTKTGVCAAGYELIRAGKTNQETLATLQKRFPTSNIKMNGVGWLRNKLRDAGEKVKTNRELVEGKKVSGKKAA